MSDRKYTVYATTERLHQVNPLNSDLWKKYLMGKRTLSKTTKDSYESDINQFFVYILLNHDNKFIFDIPMEEMADILDDYICMCASVFENNDRRLARRLSAISSIYLYFKKKRKIKDNPVELIERPKIQKGKFDMKQTFLTKEQVEIIREKLEDYGKTQLKLFFELGLYTMARVNALANIKIEDIDLEKNRIENVIEKEGYEVVLMFNEKCKELIVKWIEERKEAGIECDLLFITITRDKKGKNAKSSMQETWIKRIGSFIDSNLHCHDLRHSGANLLYQAGMPLERVSKALNHRGTQVTQDHYLQINHDELQEELEKFSV